ncbi:ABC-three component system middle component 2 [Sphingomonas sp. BK069]|uniref:ABC-three component system middle component 2 n=1 Tax=Sphingomonas sp. BK069 TaxID=2586979 RepID=UPI001610930C|nr:ABC-three component system middle component 2 [Sphingomonas sp. BK069]MBB3349462.1 hypothetical protein [Sphingomonas sp. BK069]
MVRRASPFNSPLETGIRALSILEAAHPEACDLHRLVELDYLVVHSGDAGGPASLHAALPMRAGELLVRREIIEQGLLLMASRGLVERVVGPGGISYRAGEAASPYMAALRAPYSMGLRARALWVIGAFGHLDTDAIRAITSRFFDRWTSEFQLTQLPGRAS